MALHKLVFDATDAVTRAASAQVGAVLYDSVNDRVGVINASQELQVRDDDANTALSTIAGDTTSIDSLITALSKAEDAAHSSGDQGIMGLAVRNDTEGSLVDTDGDYAPLQVDSVGRLRVVADLDVTNLSEKAEDSAHSSGDIGDYVLSVRQDTLATSTDADGDYQSFKTNSLGELYVKATDSDALLTTIDADTSSIATDASTIAGDTTSIDATLTALSKAEDSAHVSGDQGQMALAVRNDTLGSLVDTDGDYAPLQVSADGALYVEVSSIEDAALANTAIATAANALDVANTAEDVVASPLASRKYLFVYNEGNKDAYIGASGVTAATGFPLPPGSILEMRAGAAIDIEWVAADTGQSLRTLELS